MRIYDDKLIIPANIRLSDMASSEIIENVRNNSDLSNLKKIVDSSSVPEHLKTPDLKKTLSFLQFKYLLHGIWDRYGSTLGMTSELSEHRITELYDWLLKPEHVDVWNRGRAELLKELESKLQQSLLPSDSRQERLVKWIGKFQSLGEAAVANS